MLEEHPWVCHVFPDGKDFVLADKRSELGFGENLAARVASQVVAHRLGGIGNSVAGFPRAIRQLDVLVVHGPQKLVDGAERDEEIPAEERLPSDCEKARRGDVAVRQRLVEQKAVLPHACRACPLLPAAAVYDPGADSEHVGFVEERQSGLDESCLHEHVVVAEGDIASSRHRQPVVEAEDVPVLGQPH
jgi:hypothetical protein